jgi:predicted nucleotidyltransferase
MYTVGIVAEFNPFHKGHAYLIAKAREKGATHIAVAMSGAAVQRGELAVCSKHERAEAAIKCGADIVIELPAPFSCSAAPQFADFAVQILVQLGIDALAFGSEYDNPDILKKAAAALESTDVNDEISRLTASGLPYPAAVSKALERHYGSEISDVCSSPNSTLAVEYISALRRQKSDAEIIPIKRIGAGHDMPPESGYASGSYLRKAICGEGEITNVSQREFIPENAMPKHICRAENYEKILYYNLLTAQKERLTALPEMSESLADRLIKAAQNPPKSYEEFLLSAKSRNFTLARIRRSALHLTLGVEKSDFAMSVPYLRVLAFNRRGTEILSKANPTAPVSVSLKRLENASAEAKRISQIEQNAVKLMQIAIGEFENEYSRQVASNNNLHIMTIPHKKRPRN